MTVGLLTDERSVSTIINPVTQEIAFSRSVPACSKAAKRRCSLPTASFDNAVCRQAHCGLFFKINLLGASSQPLLGVAALDKGQPLPASHALIKGRLEALNAIYWVAGLITR
jgi:hypothetical protein